MRGREGRGHRGSAGFVIAFILILSSGVRGEDLSRQAKEKLVQEAESLFTAGRFEESRAQWNAALSGGASKAETRRWRPEVGRTYEAEGNYQKALATYQEAYDLDPENVDRLVDLARLYDAVEMDDQAIRYYAEAHGKARTRRDVSFALARLYKQAGRLAEARALAGDAVHAEPRDYSGQELLAEIEEAQGDLAAAARRRETVLAMHPSAAGFMILGRLWAKQGAFEQADAAFARATEAGDAGSEPLFERGVLAWRQNDPARAMRWFDQIAAAEPDSFPAGFLSVLIAREAHDVALEKKRLGLLRPRDPAAQKWKDILVGALGAQKIQ